MNSKDTAQKICSKIIETVNGLNEMQRQHSNFKLEIDLAGQTYKNRIWPPNGSYDDCYDDEIEMQSALFICQSFDVVNGDAMFQCIEDVEPNDVVTCISIGSIAEKILDAGISSINSAHVKMQYEGNDELTEIAEIEQCEPCTLVKRLHSFILSLVDLNGVLDLDYSSTVAEVAKNEKNAHKKYVKTIREAGKRFFNEDESGFHTYHISYAVMGKTAVKSIDVTAKNVEDAMKSFNEKIADEFPKLKVTKITNMSCDGSMVPKKMLDIVNASLLDECDAGGDAGAASAAAGDSAGADAGDTAAEMAGTTTAEVLGKCEPGKGYMGKDNFYIPAKAQVPLHRWEIANGGSKRKKKDKKYRYEKGAKVVVSMFEEDEMLNEFENALGTYKFLRGKTWQEVVDAAREMGKEDKCPAYERWEAAQLPPPEEDVHGTMGGCTIDEDTYKRPYLKEFFIHGLYKDGTMFELGPMKRKVASEYLSLHRLSLNAKAYQQLKDTGFSSLQVFNRPRVGGTWHMKKMENGFYLKNADDTTGSTWEGPYNKDTLKDAVGTGLFTIIKLDKGFFLKAVSSQTRIGPFTSKPLARTFAIAYNIALEQSEKGEGTERGYKVNYPAFAFSYTMAGVPCMDIVVAEDLSRAMKLFDFQWHVFDNTRPIREKFNTLQDLQRSLSLLFIKNIEIEQIDLDDIDEYAELAEMTGNPSTIPQLAHRCRNPKFRYILGLGGKNGRIVVKFD